MSGAGINCCVKSIVEGPFTLIYIYAGELYPSTHRGSAVAFCNSFGRIAAMAAPVVLMHAFKWGGGAQQPERGVLCVYSLLAGFAFMGLLAAALFTRETLGKALAVRTSASASKGTRCAAPPTESPMAMIRRAQSGRV